MAGGTRPDILSRRKCTISAVSSASVPEPKGSSLVECGAGSETDAYALQRESEYRWR